MDTKNKDNMTDLVEAVSSQTQDQEPDQQDQSNLKDGQILDSEGNVVTLGQ